MDNGLLINPSKTEAVVFGTRQQVTKIDKSAGISFAGSQIKLNDSLKVLGVKLDSALTMNAHVNEVVRACNFHIRALRHVRPYLTDESAKTVACSIVGARLDYCNALLFGISKKNIARLQRMQNALARIVCRAPMRSSGSPLLRSLHWLPVQCRIRFKIAVITYKVRKSHSPGYLSDLLIDYVPSRPLRSSSRCLLTEPLSGTVMASRAFRCSAPAVWNVLSDDTKLSSSLTQFRKRLKTELFHSAFNH